MQSEQLKSSESKSLQVFCVLFSSSAPLWVFFLRDIRLQTDSRAPGVIKLAGSVHGPFLLP